jgi:hypothetical protein
MSILESHWQDYNPHIHTPNESAFTYISSAVRGADAFCGSRIDISPEFSFAHMLHFSRIAIAFAIERGGLAKDA